MRITDKNRALFSSDSNSYYAMHSFAISISISSNPPYSYNHKPFSPPKLKPSPTKTLARSRFVLFDNARIRSLSTPRTGPIRNNSEGSEKNGGFSDVSDSCNRSCSCGRRHFIGASGAILLPNFLANASELQSDPKAKVMLNKVHPSRADWYEEFYAFALDQSLKSYEAVIAGYKKKLFTHLRGENKKVLELGVGTGPNLKYYASAAGVSVFGVDPNKKMQKYAQAAAVAAGLPLEHFNFIQAVGEALPIKDASMDAVIGTLVLCSVEDVDMALKEVKRVLKPGGLYIFVEHVAANDGTLLRFVQSVIDPLQQIVSDGCHITRETGKEICAAGFSEVKIDRAFVSGAALISPHVYGFACK
eukprot:TRINITY_DN4907_c0_g1_i1.p1 TRINITY_DN4907_c0_g1~~TRINITY_DN4907_c0_g1_i1.p1  ORF type:complete len:360 (-),score=37.15 TRINITY_DN4907_c0_g1_i1:462-1541(-)